MVQLSGVFYNQLTDVVVAEPPCQIYLCRGLDFTSQNQFPVVLPYLGIIPEIMQSVHRLIRKSDTYLPISDEYKPLLDAIVKFNKQKNKLKKK